MRLAAVITLLSVLILAACAAPYKAPDLGGLYNNLVQNESPYRNPVILIPGLLGSKLIDQQTVGFDSGGRLTIIEKGPGDGVVLRKSALMDERREDNLTSRLISPIKWSQVLFLFSDHLDLTRDPAFTDNLLYFLMESQRD